MKITRRNIDDVVVLDLKGKLMGGQEDEYFRELYEEIMSDGKRKVIINLAEVNWIASTGIGMLIRAYKTISEAGGHLVLANVSEELRRVFNVLRLGHVFPIFDTEQDAIDNLREADPD